MNDIFDEYYGIKSEFLVFETLTPFIICLEICGRVRCIDLLSSLFIFTPMEFSIFTFTFYFYLWPASVDPYHAHSWLMVYQSQNIFYRDTRVCPYMVIKFYAVLPIYLPDNPSASPSAYSGCPLFVASTTACTPYRSNSSCSHHIFVTNLPILCTTYSHSSRIGHVEMYCTTVFFLLKTYASIYSNPTSLIASSKGGIY